MAGQTRKRLNEKELGSLYLLSDAPLTVERVLTAGHYKEEDIGAIHDKLSRHAPDMAMIAMALSGNLIAEAMKDTDDEAMQPLAAELKYLSVNTLEEVGRIWIDACHYNMSNPQDISDIVNESADILCMFASIFMEVAEQCTPHPDVIRAMAAALMYQCEAQADSARAMIENANPKPNKSSVEAIPFPQELYNEHHYTDNVITFTLFSDQQTQ